MVARGAPMDWLPLEPAVVSAFPIMIAAKAPPPNAARLYHDFSLSKEGQEMLKGMQRIPVPKMWNLNLLGFSGATRELSKIRKITRTLKGW